MCNTEGGEEDESSMSAHKVSTSYSNLCYRSFFLDFNLREVLLYVQIHKARLCNGEYSIVKVAFANILLLFLATCSDWCLPNNYWVHISNAVDLYLTF